MVNRQSLIVPHKSEIRNPQSEIVNGKSYIVPHKSEIRNR